MQQNGNSDPVDFELNFPDHPVDKGATGDQACKKQQITRKHACKHIYSFIHVSITHR